MAQNKRNHHAEMGAHVGSASIVMIFAVLCLTIFAALAFETSSYEHRLAEKSAAAAQAYYIADSMAEERYLQICQLLQSGMEQDALYKELKAIDVAVELQGNQTRLYYAVPIDTAQVLQVVLVQRADAVLYTEQWNVASVTQWEYDDTLQVWDGTAEQSEE